jgi:hypothetical protein
MRIDQKPMMGRRERMKAQTAETIRETAGRMFTRLGFNHVTMRGLADAAGVSTGAIFAHVRNKEDLWRFAMGSAPPDYRLAETIALVESSLPGSKWTLTATSEGGFGAALTADDGQSWTALGECPDEALATAFAEALKARGKPAPEVLAVGA